MANSSTNNVAPSHIDGLDLLREAIVLQAVSDLRGVLAGGKIPHPYSETELYDFFCGEWAALLLGTIDGAALYGRIVKEAEEMKAAALREYEAEKAKLQAKNLTPAQYEAAIRKLVKRLKI
jgi:hypothetical protein